MIESQLDNPRKQSSPPSIVPFAPVALSSEISYPTQYSTSGLECLSDLRVPGLDYFADAPVACGTIESIYKNDTDPVIDEAITLMAEEVQDGTVSLVGQTYIFDPLSQGARALFRAVAVAQRKNPDFEFMLIVNTLSSPNYRKIVPEAAKYGANVRLACYSNHLGRGSLHSKSWVLDGNKAFIGGDNVDNTPENDYLMSFRGPVVGNVQDDLLDAWQKASRYEISGELEPGDAKEIISRAVVEDIPAEEMYPIAALAKPGIGWFGRYYENDADQGILNAISSATKSVQILGPNVNDAEVLESLCEAAERGVHVQVLLPKGYQAFQSWIDRATNSASMIYRSRLSSEAKELFEVRYFSTDGEHYDYSHAKFFGIDGEVAIVGSQNPDNQSFRFSREFNLAVCDEAAASMIRKELFDDFWKTSIPAKEKLWQTLAPIPSRGAWQRIARMVIYPFEWLESIGHYVGAKMNSS